MTGTMGSSSMEPSQEKLLLDQVHRINRARMGRIGIHLHLSQLAPYFRMEHHLRIAKRSFDNIVNNSESQAYLLQDGDIFVMCKDVSPVEIQSVVTKLRTLFKGDPLTDEATPDEKFCTWFDINQQYDDLLEIVQTIVTKLNQIEKRMMTLERMGKKPITKPEERPLDPDTLHAICTSIEKVDLSHLIRNQSAIKIGSGGAGKLLFKEYFVSIKDLQARVAPPGTNLLSGKWLFQHLTEVLDRRIMVSLAKQPFKKLAANLSVNLNLTTVLTPEFDTFDKAHGANSKHIVIELQNMDVFGDMSLYLKVREKLRTRGYKVLIDGLNPLSLQTFDPAPLEPDYFKVYWGMEYAHGTSPQRYNEMKEMVQSMGASKVVVAHVESEDAIRFGLTLGVSQFQGFYTDRLISAMANKLGVAAP